MNQLKVPLRHRDIVSIKMMRLEINKRKFYLKTGKKKKWDFDGVKIALVVQAQQGKKINSADGVLSTPSVREVCLLHPGGIQ